MPSGGLLVAVLGPGCAVPGAYGGPDGPYAGLGGFGVLCGVKPALRPLERVDGLLRLRFESHRGRCCPIPGEPTVSLAAAFPA